MLERDLKNGLFITFEGGEGSGKTTQINRLSHLLSQDKHKILTTREPGGTPEAERIRDLIVQRDGGEWTPWAEILLFCAARVMHVEQVIQPALAEGKIVICDRFLDSTLAYQGYGHEVDLQAIRDVHALSIGAFEPDLTFVLDIEPEAGLARSDRRLAAEQFAVKQREDRYEQLDIDFHKRLRQGFLEIAEAAPERCRVIDAAQSLDDITAEILKHVQMKLEG